MKHFFHRSPSLLRDPLISVVVSKDDIKRANARLMGESVSVLPDIDNDPYVRFQIPRPSREEIERAGVHAFRKLTSAG